MTENDFETAGFLFNEETKRWKILRFEWNDYKAVRSCGRLEQFKDSDDAERFIRAQAARSVVKYYLETTASSMITPQKDMAA